MMDNGKLTIETENSVYTLTKEDEPYYAQN